MKLGFYTATLLTAGSVVLNFYRALSYARIPLNCAEIRIRHTILATHGIVVLLAALDWTRARGFASG